MPPVSKGMPTTKASSSVPPPPPPPQHLLDLIKLRQEVVCPGAHPAEPLAVMTDHVTPEVLNSFGDVELATLDMITASPFYYIGTLHDMITASLGHCVTSFATSKSHPPRTQLEACACSGLRAAKTEDGMSLLRRFCIFQKRTMNRHVKLIS